MLLSFYRVTSLYDQTESCFSLLIFVSSRLCSRFKAAKAGPTCSTQCEYSSVAAFHVDDMSTRWIGDELSNMLRCFKLGNNACSVDDRTSLCLIVAIC